MLLPSLYIAVLKKVRYAHGGLCPMSYALCPMPYAQSYFIFLRKAIFFYKEYPENPVALAQG